MSRNIMYIIIFLPNSTFMPLTSVYTKIHPLKFTLLQNHTPLKNVLVESTDAIQNFTCPKLCEINYVK